MPRLAGSACADVIGSLEHDAHAEPRHAARRSGRAQTAADSRLSASRPAPPPPLADGSVGVRLSMPLQQLLLGDHVDHGVARLVVAAEHRAAVHRQHRRGRRLGLVDLDVLLDRVDQPLAHVVRRDGLLGDLAQRDHRVLVVLGVDGDLRAVGDRPRPVRRQQHQLEAVWNLVDAVLDGHARHAMIPLQMMESYKQHRPRKPASGAHAHFAGLSHADAAKSRDWRMPRRLARGRAGRAACARRRPRTGWRQCGVDLEQRHEHEGAPVHLRDAAGRAARARAGAAASPAACRHSRGYRYRGSAVPSARPSRRPARRSMRLMSRSRAAGRYVRLQQQHRVEIGRLPSRSQRRRRRRCGTQRRMRRPALRQLAPTRAAYQGSQLAPAPRTRKHVAPSASSI